jgi:hypothetical protein
MSKAILQCLLGLVVVVAAFIAGAMMCEYWIPDTGFKVLNARGQTVVGFVIFVSTLALALLARFDKRALFLTAVLIPAVPVTVIVLTRSFRGEFDNISWSGLFFDGWLIGSLLYTVLPVVISGVLVCIISMRTNRNRGGRAQGDPPNSRPPSELPVPPDVQTPDSLRTPPSGGCQ